MPRRGHRHRDAGGRAPGHDHRPGGHRGRDVRWVDTLLDQLETELRRERRIRIEVLIEDVSGLAHAVEIATASDRLDALIYPSRVDTANEVFSPTPDEVGNARRDVEAYREAERGGRGATGVDGRLVDAAHVKLAEELLARAEQIGRRSR